MVKVKQGTSQQSQQAIYQEIVKKAEPKPPRRAVTDIFLGALLTGLGVFDKLARYAGAGLAVPGACFNWPVR